MPKKPSKIKEIPEIDRPREKLAQKGPQNLKDPELLAVLLGSGRQGKSAVELAREILNKHSKKQLLKLSYNDLIKIKGISSAKACNILAAIEIVKRSLNIQDETLPIIRSVKDVVAQAVYMRDKTREHLMVLFLNARNEMIFKKPMFVGTLDSNIVHPREIFQYALKHNTASVILVHNHPSGNPEPSEQDIEITKRIHEAGKIMGIDLLDHVIITKTQTLSFQKQNMFPK